MIYRALRKFMNPDLGKICRRLAEEGKTAVEEAYSTAASPGNEDWVVSVSSDENSARLTAEGEDVMFLEFGSGLQTQTDTFAETVDFPVRPGSWSETHEKQFTSKGYWRFKEGDELSERITGTPATRGMQKALDAMLQCFERDIWNSEK